MASLIFAHSKSILAKAKKAGRQAGDAADAFGADYKSAYSIAYDNVIASEMANFEEVLELAGKLHNKYREFVNPGKQDYFLTIRPDDSKCTIEDFMEKVDRFVRRKCFISYRLSYEQKGESINDLGKGFHVHIVANMRQRAKSEVLRDTLSSWNDWIKKGWITPNNIDIRTTKNPDKIVDEYLLEYKSDDGHKEKTKNCDTIWRQSKGILDLYYNPN